MRNIFPGGITKIKNVSSKVTKCALQDHRFLILKIAVMSFSNGVVTGSRKRKREREEITSVSLCSLRSLRASMCQLLKIHKARGECQERTKFNDPHRLAIERLRCEFLSSVPQERRSLATDLRWERSVSRIPPRGDALSDSTSL